MTTVSGDIDGDEDYDFLFSFGARSMTVWTANVEPAWDSHNQMEVFSLLDRPQAFNVSNTDNTIDSRSDDKGPEPEALTIGNISRQKLRLRWERTHGQHHDL